jgi:hypothetical protein
MKRPGARWKHTTGELMEMSENRLKLDPCCIRVGGNAPLPV